MAFCGFGFYHYHSALFFTAFTARARVKVRFWVPLFYAFSALLRTSVLFVFRFEAFISLACVNVRFLCLVFTLYRACLRDSALFVVCFYAFKAPASVTVCLLFFVLTLLPRSIISPCLDPSSVGFAARTQYNVTIGALPAATVDDTCLCIRLYSVNVRGQAANASHGAATPTHRQRSPSHKALQGRATARKSAANPFSVLCLGCLVVIICCASTHRGCGNRPMLRGAAGVADPARDSLYQVWPRPCAVFKFERDGVALLSAAEYGRSCQTCQA